MSKLMTAAALVALAGAASACNGGGSATNSTNSAVSSSGTANSSAAAPATPAQSAQGEADVRAFLDTIYAPYATEDSRGADYSAVLEPQLAAALAKTEGGIDADPFIDAQDWTPFRPTYENLQVKGERAIATATFSNGAAPTRIDYQLIRTPSGWRVYDVQSANGGSLRDRIMSGSQE